MSKTFTRRAVEHAKPRWERGYRQHGLWIGTQRIAVIALDHPHIKPTGYHWGIDATHEMGSESSLRAARKSVESRVFASKEVCNA